MVPQHCCTLLVGVVVRVVDSGRELEIRMAVMPHGNDAAMNMWHSQWHRAVEIRAVDALEHVKVVLRPQRTAVGRVTQVVDPRDLREQRKAVREMSEVYRGGEGRRWRQATEKYMTGREATDVKRYNWRSEVRMISLLQPNAVALFF